MENRKKLKLALRTASLTLASMVAMGVGMHSAKATMAWGAGGSSLKPTKKVVDTVETTEIPVVDTTTEPTMQPEETKEPILTRTWSDMDVKDYVSKDDLYVDIVKIDGEEKTLIVYRADETENEDPIYYEVFSYQPVYIGYVVNEKQVFEGIGLLAGKEIELLYDDTLENYFTNKLNQDLEWKELRTMEDFAELVESIPELIGDYLVLPHSNGNISYTKEKELIAHC